VLIALLVIVGALGLPVAVALIGLLALPSLSRLKSLLPLEMPLALFLIFIAWAWASASWSPYPGSGQAWKMAAGVPLYALFSYSVWTLRGKGRLLALYAALGSILLILSLFSVEAMTGLFSRFYAQGNERQQMLREVARGVSAMVCAGPAAWAFMSMLIPGWKGRAAGVLFAGLSLVLCWHFGISAGVIAVLVSGALFASGWFFPRTTILLVGLFAVATFALAPIYLPVIASALQASDLPFSWDIRLENWQFAAERIAEKPFFGWGLDASRTFTDTYEMRGFQLPYISMHPHNVGLQLWLETGLVGVLLFCASLLAFAMRVSSSWHLSRAQGAAIAACSSAILTFSLLTFGAWQEWFWACISWVAALCILIGPQPLKLTKT